MSSIRAALLLGTMVALCANRLMAQERLFPTVRRNRYSASTPKTPPRLTGGSVPRPRSELPLAAMRVRGASEWPHSTRRTVHSKQFFRQQSQYLGLEVRFDL